MVLPITEAGLLYPSHISMLPITGYNIYHKIQLNDTWFTFNKSFKKYIWGYEYDEGGIHFDVQGLVSVGYHVSGVDIDHQYTITRLSQHIEKN